MVTVYKLMVMDGYSVQSNGKVYKLMLRLPALPSPPHWLQFEEQKPGVIEI